VSSMRLIVYQTPIAVAVTMRILQMIQVARMPLRVSLYAFTASLSCGAGIA